MRFGILFAFLIISFVSNSQICFKNIVPDKGEYSAGETICLQIQVKSSVEICESGLKSVKIYFSGLSKIKETKWTYTKDKVWLKDICFQVLDKKNRGKVTVLRKTDKENLFKQFEIKIKNDNTK